ncbi:NUDIX hydrolase [Primorskyibacter sp. S187A]|uniref:NUDIX hydrolase n=1 Tax=Primorskyibacter sp. S187A TaxID=3415130 RepID=UPI003C7DE515
MSVLAFRQAPLNMRGVNKRDLRTQFGALCYRIVKDKPQILLITSRTTKRWILPKGWPMSDVTPAQAAATEAWEEAGVKGRAFEQCLGLYSYLKTNEDAPDLPCAVLVYPVRVKKLAEEFPERAERKRKWFSPKKASLQVAEPELKAILKAFDPSLLRG